jgi:predicted nucleic acid-binding protein
LVARAEVPDTSVLIHIVRDRRASPTFHASLAAGNVWLSSIVVAELYAGTRSPEESQWIDRLVSVSQRVNRVLTPGVREWALGGRLLGRATRLYGALRPRDHLADVLLVVSAARLGGTVVTSNLRHMERWARLGAASGLDVRIASYSS